MTEKLEIWKCDICGNIVEVLHEGMGQLVCCNENMKLLQEHTQDAGNEKHVPVVTSEKNKTKVVVGEVEHPMETSHLIEWIELIVDGVVYRQFLKAGEKPAVVFEINIEGKDFIVREFCNLHGLWKTEEVN